jgi:uncharacterized protein (TIRG00374 family)
MISRSTSDEAASRSRGRWMFLLKLTVSAGLLLILFRQTAPERLWVQLRHVSIGWLVLALGLYLAMILASAWRWGLLLRAQAVDVPGGRLVSSFLVATFFNNFLPSNIGGDVIRIRDTAPAARSKTTATLIVLVDRLLGLLGLLLVAAVGASVISHVSGASPSPIWPPLIWIGLVGLTTAFVVLLVAPGLVSTILGPLGMLRSEWVRVRVERLSTALERFRDSPRELAACFVGAVGVQGILVLFYVAIARGLHIPVSLAHLAVLVPLSFVVQMLPVSVNGMGVREATFSYYFASLRLPIESALLLSLLGVFLTLVFSLSGALVYVIRR